MTSIDVCSRMTVLALFLKARTQTAQEPSGELASLKLIQAGLKEAQSGDYFILILPAQQRMSDQSKAEVHCSCMKRSFSTGKHRSAYA